MVESVLSLVLLMELLACVVSWHRLQETDMGFAAGLARALALTLASLGLFTQLLFLLHLARFPWLLDAGVLALATFSWRRGQRRFFPELLTAARASVRRPLAWLLAASLVVLAVLVWTVPPANWDSMTYNLARVLVMMRENTLAPHHYNTFRQLAFSPGFDLLHWFFLRYGLDRGMAVFSWLSYLLIVAGSFALARRKGDAAFALRVAFLVASLKLLVIEATSTKNDIGATALAVACLLGADRLLTRQSLGAVIFLLVCACYGLSTKSHFALFAVPFLVLLFWANRQALVSLLARVVKTSPGRLAASLVLLAAILGLSLASQWINLSRFDDPFGPPAEVARHENAGGIVGAGANLTRYAMDALDAPGKWWFAARRNLHERLFGPGNGPGASMLFHADYAAGHQVQEDSAWFGLLGGLLVAPCILLGLFRRGDAFTRLVSAALLVFLLAVCANITWFSYNNRFLSLFFGACAPSLAAARGLWHDRLWARRLVLAVAAVTLAAALLLNQDKPLVDASLLPEADPPLKPSIFSRHGGRRSVYDAYFNGPLLLDYLARGMYPGRQALLVAGKDSWVYPILFYGQGHHWLVAGEDAPTVTRAGETFDISDCASLKKLAGRFDVVVIMEEDAARTCLAGGKPIMSTRAPWGEVLVFSPGKDAVPGAIQ